jgi:hypothetical protein
MRLQKNKDGDIFFGSAEELKPGKYQLQAELKADMKGRGAIHQKSAVLTYNKEEIVKVEEVPEEKEAHEEKTHEEVPVEPVVVDNTIPLIIVSLLNLGVFGYFFFMVKKKVGTGDQGPLPSAVSEETLSMLVEIERLASESDVDFSDPRYRTNKGSAFGSLSSEVNPREIKIDNNLEEDNPLESE